MGADPALVKHWRRVTDQQVAVAVQAARDSVAAFSEATDASGSLIQSWVQGREVIEYEHYPPNDVVDRRRGSQFYYHAHRDGDLEHGHLHLFWHAGRWATAAAAQLGRPTGYAPRRRTCWRSRSMRVGCRWVCSP